MNGDTHERSGEPGSTSAVSTPGHVTALIRHFSDLRDRTHGGSVSRHDKETHFAHAVELLAPVASPALQEINTHLLLEPGRVIATGLQRDADGSLSASWDLECLAGNGCQ